MCSVFHESNWKTAIVNYFIRCGAGTFFFVPLFATGFPFSNEKKIKKKHNHTHTNFLHFCINEPAARTAPSQCTAVCEYDFWTKPYFCCIFHEKRIHNFWSFHCGSAIWKFQMPQNEKKKKQTEYKCKLKPCLIEKTWTGRIINEHFVTILLFDILQTKQTNCFFFVFSSVTPYFYKTYIPLLILIASKVLFFILLLVNILAFVNGV